MIKLENICYQVDGKKILDNISLIFDNKINVITGPNGAGKSTLAKIIMGIILPTSGKIYFNDIDITNMSITDRAKLGFSFAFQQPVKFKGLNVRDILDLASTDKSQDVSQYLTSVGLDANEYLYRELNGQLSGGELKRIEIAQTLARGTCVNIFDEPEAGIDLWSFNHLVDTFIDFQNKRQSVFVMISHQQKMIEIAENIIVLNGGRVDEIACGINQLKSTCGFIKNNQESV